MRRMMGIEHALLPEKGLVVSGDVIIGADSHKCTHGGFRGLWLRVWEGTDLAFGMIYGLEIGFKGTRDLFTGGSLLETRVKGLYWERYPS